MARGGRRSGPDREPKGRGRLALEVKGRPVTKADREPYASLGAHNACCVCDAWHPVVDLIRPLHVTGGGYYCGACWESTVTHAAERVRLGETLERYYQRTYGISLHKYGEMYLRQRGRCAVCHQRGSGEPLQVDHDHLTGAVRGLLCRGCNIGLGCFEDDIARLSGAISYLAPSKVKRQHKRLVKEAAPDEGESHDSD